MYCTKYACCLQNCQEYCLGPGNINVKTDGPKIYCSSNAEQSPPGQNKCLTLITIKIKG